MQKFGESQPQADRRSSPSRQPRALYLLTAIFLWERFAASVVLALFALYLREHRGLDERDVFLVSSFFLTGSYLFNLPGGWLADKWLGQPRAAVCGATTLGLGYLALALDQGRLLWPALGLLLLGSGLFRPSLTMLIGRLYTVNDPRREAEFSLWYAGLNLGYLAGPLCAEWLRALSGWSSIFEVSVLGMAITLVGLAIGYRQLAALAAANRPAATDRESAEPDRLRIRAVYLLCAVASVLWLAIQQTSTSLALFAEQYVAQPSTVLPGILHIRPGYFATLHGLLVLLLTPLLVFGFGWLRQRGAEPTTPVKLVAGFWCSAAAFALMSWASHGGHINALWLVGFYVLLSIGEVLMSAMGLSLVTQLAPAEKSARLTGLWFASVAAGNLAAGGFGLLWTHWQHSRYFASLAGLLLCAGAILLSRLRPLRAVMPKQH